MSKSKMPQETILKLQIILTDLISLALQTKQLHWNVTGPLFQPLHKMFDEMTDEYRNWYDEVAERIRALDGAPDGRLTNLASHTKIEELPTGLIADKKAIALLLKRIEAAVKRIREMLPILGELDLVTQDMILGIVEGMEKQAWMLSAHGSH